MTVPHFDEGTFRRLSELVPDALVAHARGRIVWANEAAAVLMGVASPAALVGTPVLDLVAPDRRAQVGERIARLLDTGRSKPVEEFLQRPDGQRVLVELASSSAGGDLVLVVARDITERRAAEARLAESERRHRELFEQVPVGLWEEDLSGARRLIDGLLAGGVTDLRAHFLAHPEDAVACAREVRVLAANAAACRMMGASGPSELMASLSQVLPAEAGPAFGAELASLVEGQRVVTTEGWNVTLDGRRRWVHIQATLAQGDEAHWSRLLVSSTDGTERHQALEERDALQERLRQAEKLEAVGRLAGGVAHDFNNLLASILASAELALLEPAGSTAVAESLGTIQEAARRARDLVRQILTFGRKDQPRREPVDLARAVSDALALVRSGLPVGVELEARVEPVGSVLADRTQVHQLVANLCANACEALAGRGGRVEVELAPTATPAMSDAPGTRWARLRVRDDGAGLDEATRSRLFEPYQTTRGDAGVHGLGLAVVHGVVTAAGGTIRVDSAPGRGSTFEVSLPTLDQAGARPPPAPRAVGGRERLLLVDDEPLVRAAHRRVLASLGYLVTVASDAEEALALLRAAPTGFDLVVTDMAMPGLSGFDLARQWLREQPGARVLLCTGFSDDVDDEGARAAGLKGLLLKPVSREALDGAIRAALEG